MWDSNDQLNVFFPLISYFCYDSEILGWCKTEESVSFGVCCSASNVYSHSLWESTPTMHCMDHHVSYSLWADWGKKNQPINFDFSFWFWFIWNFLMLMCLLSLHVRLVVIEARHAFHQQSHCVNYKHKEHCTSVAEGFHHVNMGFWCANWWAAWKEGLSSWSCKGTKTGVNGAVHTVYMISTLFWYLQLRSGCIYITS